MKTLALQVSIILISIFSCLKLSGQSDADFKSASSNIQGAMFPKVSPDNSVYFRLTATNARKVQVQGGDGLCPKPLDMARDSAGNWNVIIPKAGPGFHYYWFLVDGLRVNDPGSDTYFGYGRPTGAIELPVSGEDFFYAKDVPHGDVREHWYFSSVTGRWRRSFIYTPPDYEQNKDKRYPVLYLLHGAGENERGWSLQGKAGFILDNLIAAEKAVPMIVVMDNGYATLKDAPGTPASFSPGELNKAAEILEQVYTEDIISGIDSYYRTIPKKESRAMAGLSMGGLQTMLIGMKHTDMFSYFGFFSAALIGNILDNPKTAFNGVFSDAGKFNSSVKLMWFGAGSGEAMFVKMAEDARKKLDSLGIKSRSYISEGTFHEWHTWRRDLNEFAPLLFK